MSGQSDPKSIWAIMEQSEWWKQYSRMVSRTNPASVPPASEENVSSQSSGSGFLPGSSSWQWPAPEEWLSSFSGSWEGSFPSSGVLGSAYLPGYGLHLL